MIEPATQFIGEYDISKPKIDFSPVLGQAIRPEPVDEEELEDLTQARAAIIGAHNNVRLRSALSYLWPVDYYEGDPEALLAARRRKSQTARELWKQDNIKL